MGKTMVSCRFSLKGNQSNDHNQVVTEMTILLQAPLQRSKARLQHVLEDGAIDPQPTEMLKLIIPIDLKTGDIYIYI